MLDYITRMNPGLFGSHASGEMADALMGDYEFDPLMDHQTRVFRLYALIHMFKAMIDVGELEHTGDWDWGITVTYGDDQVAGHQDGSDDMDYTDTVYSDEIKLDYETEPSDYIHDFRRWQNLTVAESTVEPESRDSIDRTVTVPIDAIKSISIFTL